MASADLCFSVESIGDSASACLLGHHRDGSYLGWVSQDRSHFYHAECRFFAHSKATQHSFEQAFEFSIDQIAPISTVHVVHNSDDAVLLFISESGERCALYSLYGTCYYTGSSLTDWGTAAEVLWLYVAAEQILVLHFLSSQTLLKIDWTGQSPPRAASMTVCRVGPFRALLLLGNIASHHAAQPAEVTMLEIDWSSGAVLEPSLLRPAQTQFWSKDTRVLVDELPESYRPFEVRFVLRTCSERAGDCCMTLEDASGVMPTGCLMLSKDGRWMLNASRYLPDSVSMVLDGPLTSEISSDPNRCCSLPGYYAILRWAAGVDLSEAEIREEMGAIGLSSIPGDGEAKVSSSWLEKLRASFGSVKSISRFFYNLQVVWLSEAVDAPLLTALAQLAPLPWRKLAPPRCAAPFQYKVYDQLPRHRATYAYIHGRYDILFGDGHWALHLKGMVRIRPSVRGAEPLIPTTCHRRSLDDVDLWSELVQDSGSKSWVTVTRALNDLIARKIYKRYDVAHGQNILKSQLLRIPWTQLSDQAGLGFPWGRHGPLNRLDLWLDMQTAYINACTNLSPERMTSLFRLRTYPEIATLTRLFSFSVSQPSASYCNTLARAFREEVGAEENSMTDAETAPSPGDVIVGAIWNVLRQAYYLSGAVLGYGLLGGAEPLVECIDQYEEVLTKLSTHSGKKLQSYQTTTTVSDNTLALLDHALDYSDEPDWYHDSLDAKKSPAVNHLLISFIFAATFAKLLKTERIIEILYAPQTEARLRRSHQYEENRCEEFINRLNARFDLRTLDGPLLLASALNFDHNDTNSAFIAFHLIEEMRYLIRFAHSNIDTTTADAHDLKIDGAGGAWYKRLHNDASSATQRQGVYLGAALGTHLAMLSPELLSFKHRAFNSLLQVLQQANSPRPGIGFCSTLAPAQNSSLRRLLESSFTLSLGLGFTDWCDQYPDYGARLVGTICDPQLFLRNEITIFYRILLWCMLHWSRMELDSISTFLPEQLFEALCAGPVLQESPLGRMRRPEAMKDETSESEIDESSMSRPKRAASSGDCKWATLMACEVLSAENASLRLQAHLAVLAAVCFALALKHTSDDETVVTEFILQSGAWLLEAVPVISENQLLLAQFAPHVIGISDSTKVFAMNWIEAALGFSCAGTKNETVLATLDHWSDLAPQFPLLLRVNSARKMVLGSLRHRHAPQVLMASEDPHVRQRLDPQQLAIDILSSFPAGSHWGDNRTTPQVFDLFTELRLHDAPQHAVLYITGCKNNTLELETHAPDEEDIFLTDKAENIATANSLEGHRVNAVYYPDRIKPVELRNSKANFVYLQRSPDIVS